MKVLVMMMCAAAMIFAAPAMAEDTQLTGEPVDIGCYLEGNSGEGHAACATKCAEAGKPIGLLVGEGEEAELYLVLSDDISAPKDVIGDKMGQQVTVTGEVVENGGMKMVKVSSVE